MMCAVGVSEPSALQAQDAAAAYSVRAIHFATPFVSPAVAAPYATSARLPLGYDLDTDSATQAQNYQIGRAHV